MLATPDSFRPSQSPLGAYLPAPGSHTRRLAPSPGQTFAGIRRGGTFPGRSRIPCHLLRPHGVRNLDAGRVTLLWSSSRPGNRTASLRYACDPWLFWPNQSLPAASAPAPGPHTERTANVSARFSLSFSLRRPTALTRLPARRRMRRWRRFDPVATDNTYEPLYVNYCTAVARQRD
jgi:hypothetical protein